MTASRGSEASTPRGSSAFYMRTTFNLDLGEMGRARQYSRRVPHPPHAAGLLPDDFCFIDESCIVPGRRDVPEGTCAQAHPRQATDRRCGQPSGGTSASARPHRTHALRPLLSLQRFGRRGRADYSPNVARSAVVALSTEDRSTEQVRLRRTKFVTTSPRRRPNRPPTWLSGVKVEYLHSRRRHTLGTRSSAARAAPGY